VKSDKDSVVVTWGQGTREYTRETHGADFMALATSFASKVGGTVA
jgi:hypothetical protein